MSKAHILTIQVCIQRADGTISIYDEFPHMLRYEEEEEYLEALKYRLPLRRFDSGPLCDYECLCDVLNETYREYCHDIDLAPGERLLIRYADKPEDAPLSKKEAAKTIREMFEEAADDDRNFEKIERHSCLLFAIICSIVNNLTYPSKRVLSISPFVRRRTGCHQGDVSDLLIGHRTV